RDEAHRFAVSRHRKRRSRSTLASGLDALSGIGMHRRKLLLRRFGSLDGVRRASLPELQKELGPMIGARVHQQLHPRSEAPDPL
ncbi:MAG: excinuclease ABC subunit C, partial [Acidobacteria bacterium]|nr:excinuclease ABC subunit C [Acidobacteriota bacterium]